MESRVRPAPPTLIVLRYGDPIVDALRAAGQGPLVVLRVLPPVAGRVAGASAGEPGGCAEPLQPVVRAQLAEMTAGRRPVPRFVVRVGDPVEEARNTIAEVAPARVVCALDLARPLAAAVAVPVVGAEDAVPVRRSGPLEGALGFLRRRLDRREDAKVSALGAVPLFAGVETRDLRRLAALLDRAEVGPGHVLVAEGRRNDTLWLLLAGSVQRSIGGREVGWLEAPALVGGPSVVYDRPSIATVTALEPVSALVAGRAQYRDITGIDSVALRLKAAMADRLSEYLSAPDRRSPRDAPGGRRVLA
jgi:hypothetical protein